MYKSYIYLYVINRYVIYRYELTKYAEVNISLKMYLEHSRDILKKRHSDDKCLSYFLEHEKLYQILVATHTKHPLSQSHESKIQVMLAGSFWIKIFHKAAMKLLAGVQMISRLGQLNACLQVHLCSGWQDSDPQWLLIRDISYCHMLYSNMWLHKMEEVTLESLRVKAQDRSHTLLVT